MVSSIATPVASQKQTASSNLLPFVVVLFVILLAGLAFSQIYYLRLEKDEGYLSACSWLVASGKLPYLDFVFPQQPYFPLIYGAFLKFAGPSLVAARSLSWLLFLLLSALVAWFTARIYNKGVAFWVWLLFFANTMSLFWYPRAKHYVLADLLLFSSFFLITEVVKKKLWPSKKNNLLMLTAAGFLAGLAIQVRLLLAPATLVLTYLAFSGDSKPYPLKNLLSFLAGILLGFLPFLLLLKLAPQKWFFQCYTLQTMMRPSVHWGEMMQSGWMAVLGFFSFPITAVLGILALLNLFIKPDRKSSHWSTRPAWLMTAILGITFLLCYPSQPQYFLQLLPYLAILAAGPIARASRWAKNKLVEKKRILIYYVMVFLLTTLGTHRAIGRVIYNHHEHVQFGLASFLDYQKWMHSNNRSSKGVILTWWPGYLLINDVKPYPGTELGRPADRAVDHMNQADYLKAGLRHPKHILHDVDTGIPYWIVAGEQSPGDLENHLQKHYKLVAQFTDIYVYQRKI